MIVIRIRLLLILSILLITGCRNKGDMTPGSTPAFDSVIRRAEHIYDLGDREKALQYILSEHARFSGLTISDDMNYYTYVGEIYRKDYHDYDKYLTYADSMLAKASKYPVDLSNRMVQAHNMKADALFEKGAYNESYVEYYNAKTLARETVDNCSLSKYTHSLGMALYKQERYLDAANLFLESYRESAECKDMFIFFYHKQELLDIIGLCYYKAKMYDSALLYYQRALNFIDSNYLRFGKAESSYQSAKAVVYGNIADIYIIKKNYDTAKQLLKNSIDINLRKGFTNNDALVTQVKLAELYKEIGQTDSMKLLLTNIKSELDSIPDKRVELSWNKLMWTYYGDANDSPKAYHYLLGYKHLSDSIADVQKALVSTDIIGRLKVIERQHQIEELHKFNQQKKLYLVVAAILVGMAVVIVLLILNNTRKSRANVRELTKLNNQVNEQKTKLENAISLLKAKEKDKSRILRSVAHDIMSPISAIIALTDILAMDADDLSESHQEIIKLIKDACNNSLALSRDILEASNEIDPTEMPREEVDIAALVQKSVNLLNVRAQNKHQTIRFTCTHNITALVNRDKFWRLINNLLSNAIKFSYEGGEITINLVQESRNFHLSIQDKGIGIPEKNKAHVFEMFSDVKAHGTAGEIPHGIGLSICLQIVKAHHGSIWFESEEGKGTTFHVRMPITIA